MLVVLASSTSAFMAPAAPVRNMKLATITMNQPYHPFGNPEFSVQRKN